MATRKSRRSKLRQCRNRTPRIRNVLAENLLFKYYRRERRLEITRRRDRERYLALREIRLHAIIVQRNIVESRTRILSLRLGKNQP